MTLQGFSGFCGYLGFFLVSFFYLLFLLMGGGCLGSFFCFDYVSFFLSVISFFLLVSLYSWWGVISLRCRLFIFVSIIMSFLCYSSCNVLVFWVSYELCILPLLVLLVSESSYSERYIAFWYLLGYVVLTSLPLLLSIFYLYGSAGGFYFSYNDFASDSLLVLLVLCICFITKIPLPPFHVWLPIVHAEASSPVSVCLSGFIMKLGILGVFRFAYLIIPYVVFSYFYVFCVLSLSIVFLLLSCQELDGKRWLAILSLGHIVISVLGLLVVLFPSRGVPFIYCVGHGLSAGLVFIILWFFYDIVGSRNWNIVKYGVNNGVFLRVLFAGGLCTVASFPTTLSFFSEVAVFLDSGGFSLYLVVLYMSYLFVGGLVPLFVLGGCLSRHFVMGGCSFCLMGGVSSMLVLLVSCYFLFLFL